MRLRGLAERRECLTYSDFDIIIAIIMKRGITAQSAAVKNPQALFNLDYKGLVGRYYKSVRPRRAPANTEVVEEGGSLALTARRHIQFLDGVEKLRAPFTDKNGKVDILGLAASYGFTVESFSYPFEENKIALKPRHKRLLEGLMKESADIESFSIPKEKRIFYRSGIPAGQKNFAIAHELAHWLLKHKPLFR